MCIFIPLNSYFNFCSFLGLLHAIPPKTKDFIEDLLRECVQETKPNGRKKAISDLRDVLENYVNINDSNNRGLNSHEGNLFWNPKKGANK